MSQSTVYIGVDVSKNALDVSAPSLSRSYPNTAQGFSQILKAIPREAHIVMEATGGYERAFIQALHQAKRKVSLVNPRFVRDFAKGMGQLAKSDKIDAAMIAHYAACKHPMADPVPAASRLRLSEMVIRREQLLEARISETNRLDHQTMSDVQNQTKKIIKLINQQAAELAKLIAREIEADELLKAKSARLREVDGVGPVVTATLLAHMPELGAISRNQASALVGVAPFICESGKYKGTRRIYGGRAGLRSVIYMAALSSARKNPIHKAFYKKLRNAGKPFKVAIVAVMRKLVILMNHLLAKPNFSLAR